MKWLYSNQSFLWLCAKIQDGNQHGCLQMYVLMFFSANGCHTMTAETLGSYQTRTNWNSWANETLCSSLDLRKNNTDGWKTSVLQEDFTVSDQEEVWGRDPKTQQQKLSEAAIHLRLQVYHQLLQMFKHSPQWVLPSPGPPLHSFLGVMGVWWYEVTAAFDPCLKQHPGFLTWCSVLVLLCKQRLEKHKAKILMNHEGLFLWRKTAALLCKCQPSSEIWVSPSHNFSLQEQMRSKISMTKPNLISYCVKKYSWYSSQAPEHPLHLWLISSHAPPVALNSSPIRFVSFFMPFTHGSLLPHSKRCWEPWCRGDGVVKRLIVKRNKMRIRKTFSSHCYRF